MSEQIGQEVLVGQTRYGWCQTGDCDTKKGRGGCPVQVGVQPACPCACHKGATVGRGYLPAVVPGGKLLADDAVGDVAPDGELELGL